MPIRLPVRPRALLLAAAGGLLASAAASAQDRSADPAPAAPPRAESRPLGWLSDSDTPADGPLDALASGRVLLNNRLRAEFADTTGSDHSLAITNRLRLGYETKPWYGLTGLVEMENVFTPREDDYFVPQSGDGSPEKTPIADPPGTEVNRAQIRFRHDELFDDRAWVEVTGGRQRILLDDERFVGNVGWRQFEQTFDAISLRSDFGVEKLEATYAYIWEVRRVFGPDGPNWKSDSHLLNASYAFAPQFKLTGFLYALDFEDDSPSDSVNTYGIRASGEIPRTGMWDQAAIFDYTLTYAYQHDAGGNPVNFSTDFIAAEVGAARPELGKLTLGYQMLGSDGGDFGFRFPLGTNHKFQGFADQFVVTPAEGLHDLYVTVEAALPWDLRPAVSFHQFWSEQHGDDLGYEVDFVLGRNLTANWSALVKAAWFDGNNGQPDTARVWLETTFSF